jgi:membrane associated rhomboid family serine protease
VIPYHDENATQRTAIVTIGLIVLCALAWLVVQGAGANVPLATAVCNLGLIPGELTGMLRAGVGFDMGEGLVCVTDPGPQYSHIFTSMFLHGGWMHLIGNMWFLWLFGNNVEDSMTRPRFLAFYLICGVAAAMAQVLAEPDSIIPMVGASGAISGVMGAYLVLYPRVRVFTLVILGFFITTVALPAWVMLIYWMVIQVVSGMLQSVAEEAGGGGVAFWAHVGGFVAGVVLIKLFAKSKHVMAHEASHYRPQRVSSWP